MSPAVVIDQSVVAPFALPPRRRLGGAHADSLLPAPLLVWRPTLVLEPYLSPSTNPAASATTFLSAPQISTPATSATAFTRNQGVSNSDWNSCALSKSSGL